MARITVQVSDEQKEEWTEFQDENSAFESLSQLIRYSVEHTKENWESDSDEDEFGTLEDLEQIKQKVNDIETTVNAVENKQLSEQDIAEIVLSVNLRQVAEEDIQQAIQDNIQK